MTGPIDKAYVELEVDADDLNRDVNRELNKTFKDVERKLDEMTSKIERSFDKMILHLDNNFENLEATISNVFDNVQDDARDAAESIAVDTKIATKSAARSIDDMADKASHDFKRMEKDAAKSALTIKSVFAKLKLGGKIKALSGPAAAVGMVAGGASLLGPLNSLLIATGKAIAAIGHELALVGPAAAVLPGIGLSFALILGTAKMIGPAIGKAFMPIVDAFKTTQTTLSAIATRDLPAIAAGFVKVNFPAIANAQENIARSMNHIIVAVGTWVNSAPGMQMIRQITQATSDAMLTLEKPLARVVISFLELIKRSGGDPIRGLADGMASFLNKTSAWLDRVSSSDIQNAIDRLKLWGAAVKDAVETLREMGDWMQANESKISHFSDTLAAAGLALGLATGNIPAILASSGTLIFHHWEDIKKIFSGGISYISDLWSRIKNNPGFQQVFKSLKDSWDAFIHGFQVGLKDDKFKQWVEELKKTWNEWAPIIATWWDRVGKPALTDLGFVLGGLITIMLGLSIVVNNVWQFMGNVIKGFVFIAVGVLGIFVNAAANAFSWIPGIGPKLNKARDDFNRFASDVNKSLGTIKDRSVNVTVNYREVGRAVAISNAYQSGIGGRAKGGPIRAGQTYMTGEQGYELITPSKDAWVWNHNETEDMLKGSKLPMDRNMRESKTTSTSNQSMQSGFYGTVVVHLGDEQIENPVIKIMRNNASELALATENGTNQLSRRR